MVTAGRLEYRKIPSYSTYFFCFSRTRILKTLTSRPKRIANSDLTTHESALLFLSGLSWLSIAISPMRSPRLLFAMWYNFKTSKSSFFNRNDDSWLISVIRLSSCFCLCAGILTDFRCSDFCFGDNEFSVRIYGDFGSLTKLSVINLSLSFSCCFSLLSKKLSSPCRTIYARSAL